VIKLAECC